MPLACRLGVPRKTVVPVRDVPGMSRSVIPVLSRAGVLAINEAPNGGMIPTNVPPAFIWKDRGATGVSYSNIRPPSGVEILAMWSDPGVCDEVCIRTFPGCDVAVYMDWQGEDSGPNVNNASDVLKLYDDARKLFPGAEVRAAGLEDKARALLRPECRSQLPVLDMEVGDTWIYGIQSEPRKVASLRAAMRHRAMYKFDLGSEAHLTPFNWYQNFSRLLLKGFEHTWGGNDGFCYDRSGKDLPGGMSNPAGYYNAKFHAARADPEGYPRQNCENYWIDQTNWAIKWANEAIEDPDLRVAITDEVAQLASPAAPDPQAEGFTRVGLGTTIELSGNHTIAMCGNVSAICSFRDAHGVEWASEEHPLGLFSYSLYTTEQFDAFLAEYCPNGCSPNEFSKPGMPRKEAAVVSPNLQALWIKRRTAEDGSASDELLALGTMPATLNQDYGAPSQVWLRLRGHTGKLDLEITLVNKTATRFAEAGFLTFAPETGNGDGVWAMDKLGEWVSPLDVADGGSKGMHPVGQGVLYAQSESSPKAFFRTLDAGVVKFGQKLPFPTPMHAEPDMSHGVHFLLHDNAWNTNYVFWWPYATPSNQDNLLFRFAIESVSEPNRE